MRPSSEKTRAGNDARIVEDHQVALSAETRETRQNGGARSAAPRDAAPSCASPRAAGADAARSVRPAARNRSRSCAETRATSARVCWRPKDAHQFAPLRGGDDQIGDAPFEPPRAESEPEHDEAHTAPTTKHLGG